MIPKPRTRRAAGRGAKTGSPRFGTVDSRALAEVVDRLPAAVVLLDRRGRVRHANRAALDLLERRDGVAVVADEALRAAIASETRSLERALAECARRSDDGVAAESSLRFSRPSGGAALEALLVPLDGGRHDPSLPVAALFVTDPEAVTLAPADTLRRLYRLSRAEAALARELGAGSTLAQAASRLGIRTSTARGTLKLVFEKMGVRRQADLVRRLAGGIATFASDGPPPPARQGPD